jgi:hypothetical protein
MVFWVDRRGSNVAACCYPLVRHRLRLMTSHLQLPTCWPHCCCWPTKALAATHRRCNEDPPSGDQFICFIKFNNAMKPTNGCVVRWLNSRKSTRLNREKAQNYGQQQKHGRQSKFLCKHEGDKTHTHSNARARTNWASRRRSVTTHNTWSCSRDRGKMATHSLTKRSFQKNNLEKQVPKGKKQTNEVFSMKRKKN